VVADLLVHCVGGSNWPRDGRTKWYRSSALMVDATQLWVLQWPAIDEQVQGWSDLKVGDCHMP